MYRIWKGLDARFVIATTSTLLFLLSIYIHFFAFHITGYPKSAAAKYNPPASVAP